MTKSHTRKQIRLKKYDYSQPGYYFVTICTQNRKNMFGEIKNGQMVLNEYGKIVDEIIQFLPKRYPQINLDIYQIMPNHIHFIIRIVGAIHESPVMIHESPVIIHTNTRAHHDTPLQQRQLLPKCIGYFKMNTAKYINKLRNTSGQPVWQRNYYEHIIRNKTELNKIREYIRSNPEMWGKDENNLEN